VGTKSVNIDQMTDLQAEPASTDSVIEVRRRRRLSDVMAIGWRVFIDGTWVGAIPQGKTVRFNVAAGRHALKIWSHKGAYCSDEIELDAAPGSINAFECRAQMPSLGLSRVQDQVSVITSTLKDVGVTRGQILLVKVPQTQAP
jgi:hypothetical protein